MVQVQTLRPIVLKKLSRRELIRTRRARLSRPLRVLTSPKTTLALGATLASLSFAPAAAIGVARGVGRLLIPKKLSTALLLPSAAVVLKESVTARRAAKGILRGEPGKVVAGLIERAPSRERTRAEKTGLLGLGAAAIAGLGIGVAATKKGKEIVSQIPIPSIPKLPKRKKAAEVIPMGIQPAPPSLVPSTQPIGAVQQVKEPVAPSLPVEKPITIKNTFKPSVDISFRKSKRFINQQINVRR